MNRPNLKLVGGIALLAVLGALYFGFLLLTNTAVNGAYSMDALAAKMKAINSSVGGILDLNAYVEDRELELYSNRAALSSIAAKGLIRNDWDGKSTAYSDGVIVKASGGRIDYPENYPEDQKINAATLTDNYGRVSLEMGESKGADASDDALIVEYYKIGSDTYYIECELQSALEKRARLSFDGRSWIKGIEDAFDMQILLVSGAEEEDGSHTLLYKPDALPKGILTAEACGITEEMLEAAPDGIRPLTNEELLNFSKSVELEGTAYRVYIQTANGSALFDEKVHLVYLIPEDEFVSMTVEQTVIIWAAFLVVGVILLVWFFSLIRLVRHYRLDEEQALLLGAKRTVRKAFSMIVIGCVMIFITAALFLSLFRLFDICKSVKQSINVLEQRIEENKVQEKTTADELNNIYVSYAERIAGILKERPELKTKENLQAFSDLIGTDYIMLYDHDGKEVITNASYIDMELGTSPDSSTYEFRRLLKGVPSVVHDVKTDEETGLKNALIGVCLESPGEADKYEALLVAVPWQELLPKDLETLDYVLKSLASDGTFAFSVNPENQTIVNASNAGMVGRNATSLNLPEVALTDSYRDFFTVDNKVCYGESKDIDGLLYYYAAEKSHIYENTLIYSGIAAAAAFLLLAVMIAYLMFGYRKGFEYWSAVGEELTEQTVDRKKITEDPEQRTDPRKRWDLSLSRHGLRTPIHNALVTLEILLVGIVVVIWVWYLLRGKNISGSLLGFILHGQWTKGVNLFSVTSILILFAQTLILVTILKILIRIICSSMGPKGETFGRLLLNLLSYAGVIFFIFMALYNLGINLAAIIASLSLPAFALSLGAKDLITDIVAGISIVFDGEFKVGDIIEINGYRGTVLEIGVRTTKLQGKGGNILIIANRDVKNVTNMSRKTSTYFASVRVSTSYELKDVEKMLREELPKFQEKIPWIVGGPYYKGVSAVGEWDVTLSIAADCAESDYYNVQKALHHAFLDLFEEKGITIRGIS